MKREHTRDIERRATSIRLALLGTLLTAGCDRASSATEGMQTAPGPRPSLTLADTPTARPVEDQPVGPIPGPGDVPPLANPLSNDRSALQEGRQLFVRYNCAGCHGGRAGGGMGPSLRDSDWLYGSSPDRIFGSIAQGRGHGMPSWGARLPEKQIWELTAYVSSLRTPDEPEAP